MNSDLLNDLPGGPDLIAWFDGHVPSFHDSEILEIVLERTNSSCRVKIYGCQITEELEEGAYFKNIKHVVVTFQFDHVVELELTDFNHQNVIDGLVLTRLPNGNILLKMEQCYGLFGKIEAKNLHISLEPGRPIKTSNPQ